MRSGSGRDTHRKLIQTPISSPLRLHSHRPEIHRMRYRLAIARDEVGVDGLEEEGVGVFSVFSFSSTVSIRIHRTFRRTSGVWAVQGREQGEGEEVDGECAQKKEIQTNFLIFPINPPNTSLNGFNFTGLGTFCCCAFLLASCNVLPFFAFSSLRVFREGIVRRRPEEVPEGAVRMVGVLVVGMEVGPGMEGAAGGLEAEAE